MKVEIRKNLLKKSGMYKLYLYIYKGYTKIDGKIKHDQTQKTLDLELYPNPKDEEQRKHNEEVLKIAEDMRAETYLKLSKQSYEIPDKNLAYADFFLYAEKKLENSASTKNTVNIGYAAVNHLRKYTEKSTGKARLAFNSINNHFLEGFKKYLQRDARTKKLKPIKPNTAKIYFEKIGFVLNQAVKDRIIEKSPAIDVRGLQGEEVRKDRLSIEDIRKLMNTNINDEVIKQAFLFMCFTGLRFVDVKNLKYGDIKNGNGYTVSLRQEKTDKIVTIPLNEEALKITGIPTEDNIFDTVFKGLVYSPTNNQKLENWVLQAKIFNKKITWHSARHTFGQLLHDKGVDIATIADLMGDTIQTVLKNYVRVSESTKVDAVNKLSFINTFTTSKKSK